MSRFQFQNSVSELRPSVLIMPMRFKKSVNKTQVAAYTVIEHSFVDLGLTKFS